MRTLTALLLLLSLGVGAGRPRPARNARVVESICPASGQCRVILVWTRPKNYVATTDLAHVTWSQATPSASMLRDTTTKGTADTLLVARPDTVAKKRSGPVKLCYDRAGWTGAAACNAAITWTVSLPVAPVDTATDLKVLSVIIKPESAKVAVLLPGRTPADSNRIRFCAGARLSDDSVILTVNSDTVSACRTLFAGVAGFKLSHNVRVPDDTLRIHMAGAADSTEYLLDSLPDGTLRHIWQTVKVTDVEGAFYMHGEWWLRQPMLIPSL